VKEFIFGRNPVFEVIRAGRRQVHSLWVAEGVQEKGNLSRILALAEQRKLLLRRVPRSRLDHLSDSHQGLALEVEEYPYVELEEILDHAGGQIEPPLVLLLDVIQNPQNLGTLLRTAEAVGVHGVIIPERRGAGVTPAVVQASSGACEHMRIAVMNLVRAIQALKERDLWIVGMEGSPEASLPGEIDLSGPLGLVIGNEGEGMRRLVRQSCDFILRLPMRGQVESLNAAVAGSVALYLVWQARGFFQPAPHTPNIFFPPPQGGGQGVGKAGL
jgi:23S rRNA (guanosine2251-2'-O)-methyltransferase